MEDPDSSLHKYSDGIILVEDPIVNNISSTVLRQQLAQVVAPFTPQLKARPRVLCRSDELYCVDVRCHTILQSAWKSACF